MHVHGRRITATRKKSWAVVVVQGHPQIVRRFWKKSTAERFIENRWPGYDSTRIRVEKIT